jgi:GTPase SAR1 family protein
VVVLGNKSDLVTQRHVTEDEAEKFAEDNACSYMEVSAVTGEGIRPAFEKMAELVLDSDDFREISDVNIAHRQQKKKGCPC